MESVPPGWYPDSSTAAPPSPVVRWWDGTRWTEHVAPVQPPQAARPEPRTPDGAPLASWGPRLGAYVIDSFITGIIGLAFTFWFYLGLYRSMIDLVDDLDPVTGELPPGVGLSTYLDDFWTRALAAFAIGIAVTLTYHVVFLRWWSRTPGKRLVGLRVRPWQTEGRLGWGAVLTRAGLQHGLFALLGLLYVHVLDGLWPLWDQRRQALHDKGAGTVVVTVSRDDAP